MAGYLPDGCMWPSDADYYEYLNRLAEGYERALDEPDEFDEIMQLEELELEHRRDLEQEDAELLDWSERHGHYK